MTKAWLINTVINLVRGFVSDMNDDLLMTSVRTSTVVLYAMDMVEPSISIGL